MGSSTNRAGSASPFRALLPLSITSPMPKVVSTATQTTTTLTTKTSSIRSWPLVAAAVALFTMYARTLYRPSFLTAPPPLVMSNDERAHVLKDFFAGAPPNKSNTTAKDTVLGEAHLCADARPRPGARGLQVEDR